MIGIAAEQPGIAMRGSYQTSQLPAGKLVEKERASTPCFSVMVFEPHVATTFESLDVIFSRASVTLELAATADVSITSGLEPQSLFVKIRA